MGIDVRKMLNEGCSDSYGHACAVQAELCECFPMSFAVTSIPIARTSATSASWSSPSKQIVSAKMRTRDAIRSRGAFGWRFALGILAVLISMETTLATSTCGGQIEESGSWPNCPVSTTYPCGSYCCCYSNLLHTGSALSGCHTACSTSPSLSPSSPSPSPSTPPSNNSACGQIIGIQQSWAWSACPLNSYACGNVVRVQNETRYDGTIIEHKLYDDCCCNYCHEHIGTLPSPCTVCSECQTTGNSPESGSASVFLWLFGLVLFLAAWSVVNWLTWRFYNFMVLPIGFRYRSKTRDHVITCFFCKHWDRPDQEDLVQGAVGNSASGPPKQQEKHPGLQWESRRKSRTQNPASGTPQELDGVWESRRGGKVVSPRQGPRAAASATQLPETISASPQQGPLLAAVAPQLPEPVNIGMSWQPVFDENAGSYYYYNTATGQTQWEPPY